MDQLNVDIPDQKYQTIERSPLKVKKQNQDQKQSVKIPEDFDFKKFELPDLKIESEKEIKTKVLQKMKLKVKEDEIFCVRFDPDDTMLATGYSDGMIRIYNLQTGKIFYSFDGSDSNCPTTSLRWRPPTMSQKAKNLLLSANSDGTIITWHLTSGKELNRIYEETNYTLCLDYNKEGTLFASGGKDNIVRIYDDQTKQISATLQQKGWHTSGHSNRIFSLKFLYDEPNLLLSGGSDKNIHIWDLRQQKSAFSIFGPYICGDSLDYRNGQILAGSYKNKENLQIFDLKNQQLLYNVDWEQGKKSSGAFVYAAQFSKINDETILAGSSGSNEAKIFNSKELYKPIVKISNFDSPIYSIDYGNSSPKLAISCSSGGIYILTMQSEK